MPGEAAKAAADEISVGSVWPVPNPAGDRMAFGPAALRPSVEVALIEVLFDEELLIEELFAVAEAGEPLGACTSFPLEREDATRFKSPIYTIDPPGDHWAEALKARAKDMTSKTIAAFFAFSISFDSSNIEINCDSKRCSLKIRLCARCGHITSAFLVD